MNGPLRHPPKVISDGHHRDDAENSERQLPELRVPFETKRHPRVQEIVQAKPVAQYIDLLVKVHVVMHQHFGSLIDQDHDER